MTDRSCPVCDAHTTAGDRFCAACGMRLDAPVVLDGDNPSATATTEHVRSGGRLSALLVPLLLVSACSGDGIVTTSTLNGSLGPASVTDRLDPVLVVEPPLYYCFLLWFFFSWSL